MNFINVFLFEVDCSKSARNEESILTRRLEQPPRFGRLGAPVESGDRAKRCLSEGSAAQAFQVGRKCAETSDDVIKYIVQNPSRRVKSFSVYDAIGQVTKAEAKELADLRKVCAAR